MAQELLKGARWVGGQGLQAWNNYWSRPSSQEMASRSNPYSSQAVSLPPAREYFPPTHANDTASIRKTNQPVLVSVIDLEKLISGQHMKPEKIMQPVATFALTYGCSFVSFAPDGLHLLTTSTKGDVQQIWSLFRMANGGYGYNLSEPERKPHYVREVKRITRMTEATIIDIAWKPLKGEKLAIVTDRGTVHVYDIPSSALHWPPARRLARLDNASTTSTKHNDPDDSPGVGMEEEQSASSFGAA